MKKILFAILFVEIQVLLAFAIFQYQQTKALEQKVKRTNIFLNEIYKENSNLELSVINKYDIVAGDPLAPKSLIMYLRNDCSACQDFKDEVLPQILEAYVHTGRVKLVFRPLYHPQDSIAAFHHQYAFLASKMPQPPSGQTIINLLMDNASDISELRKNKVEMEEKMGGNFANHRLKSTFTQQMQQARSLGINRTPSFIIGNQRFVGNRKFAKFQQLLAGR